MTLHPDRREEQMTAWRQRMDSAVKSGDAKTYLDAVKSHPDFMAKFPDGISKEAEAGIMADFQRDQLRTNGEGFSFDKLGQNLQGMWDKLMKGDFMGFFQSLMGLFNGQADPGQLAQLDQKVDTGLTGMQQDQKQVYRDIVDQTKPNGSPALS